MSRALRGLCAAVLDLEPEAARELEADLAVFASRLPRRAGAALRAGAATLEAISLLSLGKHLDQLAVSEREELISRLGRSSPSTDLIEALKIPVLLVHGAKQASADLAARLEGPPARPDAELRNIPAAEWPARATADVVIVGSGAGGAVAARALALEGLSTVVVEEGRRFGVEEFRNRPALERFTDLYRDGGTTVALGRPPIVLPMGRGVGGTTLVNSGTCYRTPRAALLDWRDTHGVAVCDPDAFDPLLDDIERMLQVAPVPNEVMGQNGRLALAGAAALGWSAHPIRRNAPGCGGCCQCAVGCPRNAKYGVHLSVLPDACRAGATIVSEARVSAVMHGAGRVTGIRGVRRDGTKFEILAPRVVVAAGATETPALLRRSGLGGHAQLGRNLAIHPAVSIAGWFAEPVHSTRGVLQSAGIDELHESDGILIEATATPPGMGSMVLPGAGRRLAEQLDRFEHLATLGAMVGDEPSGAVHGSRRPLVRYNLAERDAGRLLKAIGAMGRVLFAAGATEVVTGIAGHAGVHDERELDEAVAAAKPSRLHVAAFHPTGTARMGRDPETHPVDESGRLRGVDGVWVADASVVPSCPGVNPQLTIMALSTAVARSCVQRS